MILPNEGTRAMSANVWIDPQQRLCLFWGQSAGMQDGRFGVWAMMTTEPDANNPKWSALRRIGDGIMMNKPTVLANGDWLLTSSVWKADNSIKVYASTDQGATFTPRGKANVPDPKNRVPDEPTNVERRDGSRASPRRSRAMAARGGRRWPRSRSVTAPRAFSSEAAVQRASTREARWHSGKHQTRKSHGLHLDEDGHSWLGGLMLDEREDVTYPDGVQSKDGTIYLTYDHQRTPLGEILMAKLREEDVREGKIVSAQASFKQVIDRLNVP